MCSRVLKFDAFVDTHLLPISDMARYSSSDYLGNYDMECPQGVFIPSYAPTPTLSPVLPGEPGEPGPPGPRVSIKGLWSTSTSCKCQTIMVYDLWYFSIVLHIQKQKMSFFRSLNISTQGFALRCLTLLILVFHYMHFCQII